MAKEAQTVNMICATDSTTAFFFLFPVIVVIPFAPFTITEL